MSTPQRLGSRAGGQKSAKACASCHIRKVKCDLVTRGSPPCTRCEDSGLPCDRVRRRRRPVRSVEAALVSPTRLLVPEQQITSNVATTTTTTATALDEVSRLFSSLGVGDNPRRIHVSGFGDISKQSSILVDFVAQDFSIGALNDYQVTFNDNYTTVARILADEFGRGFRKDIYHYRDAPFLKRSDGGIPRTLGASELAVLDLYGSFILPSPEIADSFVAAFFDRVHPTLPIIDRSGFMKRYYSAATKPSNTSLLLIQSILLSGSTTFEHPSLNLSYGEVSWRLYGRAKALVDNRFEQDRLVLVQAHLLFSTFVSDSCDDTIQNMWLSLGSAIRIAQGLGMHRSLGKANASDSMRRQWKRIWWSLFVHDTLCSFEWGRPRAINLADSDVEELNEIDFQPEDPGSLPSTEHTQFFLELYKLCLIIADWLDLLRPGGPRRHKVSTLDRSLRTLELLADLENWHKSVPAILRPPENLVGFSLWTATLHITYQAVLLRFSTLLSDGADTMSRAAMEISSVCEDLDRQDLLGSLWNFGIHEFDLAMCQHAREANSKDPVVARQGLLRLKRGLPWVRKLGKRSAVAIQAQVFYEELVKKMNHSDPVDDEKSASEVTLDETIEGTCTLQSQRDTDEPLPWTPDLYLTNPLYQPQMMEQDGVVSGWDNWDSNHEQTFFHQY
ncbi:hypothetical protein B7463_g2470, partial [Scytalidium lignicola]